MCEARSLFSSALCTGREISLFIYESNIETILRFQSGYLDYLVSIPCNSLEFLIL